MSSNCIGAGANALLAKLVDMEMAGLIERWYFAGDAVHILLSLPTRACCGAQHWWFINRDGRTRCVECDANYLAERAASQESRDGVRARTARV